MTQLLRTLPRLTLTHSRELAMTLLPHGGQRAARQNAWAGMSADLAMSRARREAEAAMDQATTRARHRSAVSTAL